MPDAYLTFSGGPHDNTYHILDILKEWGARATFFPYGSKIQFYPENVKRIHREGHVLGNGCFREHTFGGSEPDEIRWQMSETDCEIVRLGLPKPTLYRPPYGATSELVRAVGAEQGMKEVLWDIDSRDAPGRTNRPKIVSNVMDNVEDGSVVLLHDGGHYTLDVLPEIIEALRNDGFSLGGIKS